MWQVCLQLLSINSGLWDTDGGACKERLLVGIAGAARALVSLDRSEEVVTWAGPMRDLGLHTGEAWAGLAWGRVLSSKGRFVEAAEVLEMAAATGSMLGGCPEAVHLAAQALHRKIDTLQPEMSRIWDQERGRELGGQMAAPTTALDSLGPGRAVLKCGDCEAGLGKDGEHVCGKLGRRGMGVRQFGPQHRTAVEEARQLLKCQDCLEPLEPGCEGTHCRGEGMCLVCRDCALQRGLFSTASIMMI